MPWNGKTTKKNRKRWSRFLRRNYRAEKRELAIAIECARADLDGFWNDELAQSVETYDNAARLYACNYEDNQ